MIAPALLPAPAPASKTTLSPEMAAKLSELCRLARQRGFLTHEEVAGHLSESLVGPDDLEAICSRLREAGVRIADPTDADQEAEFITEAEASRPRLECLDDPVEIYLRDVRRTRRLTRTEELAVFHRMEAAQAGIRQVLYGLGFAAQEHLALAEKLLSESPDIQFDRVVLEENLDCRAGYLGHLPELVDTVRDLDARADRNYAAFQEAPTQVERERLRARGRKLEQEMRLLLPRFFFRPNVAKAMVLTAQSLRQELALASVGPQIGGLVLPFASRTAGQMQPAATPDFRQALERRLRMPAPDFLQACARLDAQAAAVEQAKHEIVVANLRLVVHVARKYTDCGLPLLDLIQEGNLGLMKTVERFDFRRGCRFCTFAVWGIRETIVRSIANQGRLIRIPVYMHATRRRLISAQRVLLQSLGREPTIDEVADELHLPAARIGDVFRLCEHPVSLHSPVGEHGTSCLGDVIEDETAEPPGEAGDLSLIRDGLADVLASLTPREREVVELRFGLKGNPPTTLEGIGRKFGITRERVRQIEANALSKLRHPSRSVKLRWAA